MSSATTRMRLQICFWAHELPFFQTFEIARKNAVALSIHKVTFGCLSLILSCHIMEAKTFDKKALKYFPLELLLQHDILLLQHNILLLQQDSLLLEHDILLLQLDSTIWIFFVPLCNLPPPKLLSLLDENRLFSISFLHHHCVCLL